MGERKGFDRKTIVLVCAVHVEAAEAVEVYCSAKMRYKNRQNVEKNVHFGEFV